MMLAYSLNRVSVILVIEEANCLIRLACANNGGSGGDPTSLLLIVQIIKRALSKTYPESTAEKKAATASGIGRPAQWARAST